MNYCAAASNLYVAVILSLSSSYLRLMLDIEYYQYLGSLEESHTGL